MFMKQKLFLFFFLICSIGLTQTKNYNEDVNILILHSYYPTFEWSSNQTTGIIRVLSEKVPNASFNIEYMDARRNSGEVYLQKFAATVAEKYRNKKVDVIISCDNYAFEFMVQKRDSIFGNVPLVFCGVNGYSEKMHEGVKGITGVAEQIDVQGNLETMKRLFPNRKKVYIVNGSTTLTEQKFNVIIDSISRIDKSLQYVVSPFYSLHELAKELSQLNQQTMVLMFLYNKDKEGKELTNREATEFVVQNTNVPVFGMWDFQVGTGIIGGNIISAENEGQAAAEKVIQILNGTKADNIAISHSPIKDYIFDYLQLKDYEIKLNKLPVNHRLINKNIGIRRFTKYIISLSIISGLLIVIVIIILVNRARIIKSKKLLQRSIENYHDLANNIPNIVFRINSKGKYVFVNEQVEWYTGISKSDLIGKTAKEANLSDETITIDNQFLLPIFNSKTPADRSFSKEIRGKKYHFKAKYVPEFDSTNNVEYVLGVIHDITSLKHLENILTRKTEINKTLVELSQDILNPELNIDSITKRVLHSTLYLTGCDQGEIISYSFDGIVSSHKQTPNINTCNCGKAQVCASIKDNNRNDYLKNASNKSGSLCKWFNENTIIEPIIYNNKSIGQINVIKPQTLTRNDVIEIIRQLGNVFALAVYRKNIEDDLLVAREKAVESDTLKSRFLANMSHEIRTPLNGILGFSQLLISSEQEKEKQIQFYDLIESSSQQLLRIIEDVLDLSKIESNQLVLYKNDFNVTTTLKKVFEQFSNICSKPIDFIYDNQLSDNFIIHSDKSRLIQLVSNTLDNAIKFTTAGSIKLSSFISSKNELAIEIKDSGIGIKKSDFDLIFNRLTKIDHENTLYSGAGMGLSIVRGLAKLLEAKIELNSEVAKGTSFKFLFTLKKITPKNKI